jgi:putative ABC transport system permease protein
VLARAASRNVEMAIRQSIGAGRGRLIRQLLTENLLLSGAGALGGLAFAYWCTRLLMAVQLPSLSRSRSTCRSTASCGKGADFRLRRGVALR